VRFPDIARSSPQPRSSGIQSGLGDDNGKSRKESDVRRSTIEEDEPNSNVPRNPQRLIASAEETLAIARKSGNRRDESNALGNLGIASHSLGEYRRAFEYYEQALAIDREIGDRRGEGTALWNMSSVLDKLGDRKKAIEYAEAALKIFEEIEDPRAADVRKQLDLWKTG
jgi:tetratricopeptide (TPR) repeat protein